MSLATLVLATRGGSVVQPILTGGSTGRDLTMRTPGGAEKTNSSTGMAGGELRAAFGDE